MTVRLPVTAIASAGTPPRPSGRVVVKKRDTEQAHICVGTSGLSRSDPDRFAFGVAHPDTTPRTGRPGRLQHVVVASPDAVRIADFFAARLGFRITKGWVADLFLNGTAGPQPVGNTLHGGVGLRITY